MALYTGASTIDVVLSRLENNDRFYTREQIRKVINLCIRNTNLWLGWYQGSVDITTVSGRVAYDVPNNIIFPMTLTLEGRVINKSAFGAMVADNQKLWKDSTANTGVPVSDWSLIGIRKFVIYPADARGGRVLRLSGVMEPPVFNSESDSIVIPVNIYNAIVDYVTHLVQLKISGQPFLQSQSFLKMYIEFMKLNMLWRSQGQVNFMSEVKAEE